jgi:hypothetical protein
MTRVLQVSAIWAQKKPFVFNGLIVGFANFSKFFLGRNEGNQRVAREKIWIRDFWISPPRSRP